MARSIVRTACNRDCPDACSILGEVENGRVIAIRGDPDHPITRGFLCNRTNRYLERQYHPERLRTPLLRRSGGFVPISWDEALDLAASKLTAIRAESGPAAVFHYRSGGSLGVLKHLADYFFELFGPVTVKRGDICSGAGEAAQLLDFGESDSNDLLDLTRARHIILWGKNPYVSNVHLLPVLKEAQANGAKLVLIDPVHHRTARLCERYVQPRPGGDLALAMGVAQLLFRNGTARQEGCENVDDFRRLCLSRSIRDWAAGADVPVQAIEDLAARLADRPCAIQVGWGMQRRSNGAAIVRALDALCALSGNLGISGGGSSFYFKRRDAFDFSFIRGESARTVCEPLFGPELLGLDDPPVRACWITAGNPVAMLPESETIVRALERVEFLVVADQFLTDTARLAHLVLPAATMLEEEDLVGAYGHHWLGSQVPLVEPEGEALSDLEILQRLAVRVGLGDRMAGSAREWKRRLLRKVEPLGVTLESLEKDHVRNPLAPALAFEGGRCQTPAGRARLMTSLPEELPGQPGYPLYLMSLSTDKAQSSQWAGPPGSPEGPAEARVHPDAAGGIADGEKARLESPAGAMTVRVVHDAMQRRDVAIVPKGGERRHGRCVNALIQARLTDAGEGGALYDQRVRLVRA